MDPNTLTPGQRAQVDQTLALLNEVERAWPWNQQLLNDPDVEALVLDRLRGEEGVTMRSDRAHLIWGHGRIVELDHALNEHDITRQVMRSVIRPETECDVCPVTRAVVGVAVVAVPVNLVALVLCGCCVDRLRPDVLIPINFGGTDA